MCLAAIAISLNERFPFVLASNRDEYFAREARPLEWWQPASGQGSILSGRDLAGGGTWLGLNAHGRLALLTNVREPGRSMPESPSRGKLVVACLTSPEVDLPALARIPRNGFNLLVFDLAARLPGSRGHAKGQWVSNRPSVETRTLGAGIHGVSNASLDTPWPKVRRLKDGLRRALQPGGEVCGSLGALADAIWPLLQDASPAADADLPSTGLSPLRERQLSSAFIRRIDGEAHALGDYGTRCSTLVVVERSRAAVRLHVLERTHDRSGDESLARTRHVEMDLPAE